MANLRQARLRCARHYLNLLKECDRLYYEGGTALERALDLIKREWANIQAGQAWAEKFSHGASDETALCSDYPYLGAHVLNLFQHPQDRVRWLDSALGRTQLARPGV